MVCKAVLVLDNPNTQTIVSAIGKLSSKEKIKIDMQYSEKRLTVKTTAKDSIALRAGLNTFMNLYNLSNNIIKGIAYE